MPVPDIREQLTQAATDRRRPDGTAYRSLSSAAVQQLARRWEWASAGWSKQPSRWKSFRNATPAIWPP